MALDFLNKVNLSLEKGRIMAVLLGAFGAIIIQLAKLYELARYIVNYEVGYNFYDYVPYINTPTLVIIGIIFAYIGLLWNTSAIESPTKRMVSFVFWALFFILEIILQRVYWTNFWFMISIIFIRTLLEMSFFIITFKARPVMNVILLLVIMLRLANTAFRVIIFLTDIEYSIPFSTYYINMGVTLIKYFWLMIYLFSITGRSKEIRDNMEFWSVKIEEPIAQSSIPQKKINAQISSSPSNRNLNQTHLPQSPDASHGVQTQTMTYPNGDKIYPIPRALFWCGSCQKQVKIRLQPNEIYQDHNCPECGTKLYAWWARGPQAIYYKFLIGLAFMGGGLFSIMIEGILNEGLIPVIIMNVLGLIYLVVGLFLMLTASKLTVTGPPEDASSILPKGVHENFGKQIVIITIFATVGGLFLFGFARIITLLSLL